MFEIILKKVGFWILGKLGEKVLECGVKEVVKKFKSKKEEEKKED